MKTLGRVLIILGAFALVMGITYAVVNASGSSLAGGQRFENGDRSQFANSERPFPADGQFQPRQRPEGFEGRERGGGSFFGLMGGFAKNTIVIAVVVVLIAAPRNWFRNRKRTALPATAE